MVTYTAPARDQASHNPSTDEEVDHAGPSLAEEIVAVGGCWGKVIVRLEQYWPWNPYIPAAQTF